MRKEFILVEDGAPEETKLRDYVLLYKAVKYEHTYDPGNNFVVVKNKRKDNIAGVFDYTELYVYLKMHHPNLL
ncbi:hypothetical protein Glove_16g154 [Diversispora epigaea]|uniref:Uncharacterized protein n=1 Tax=Diversispora epigaea TaxID=1348612 RepID=A0A397JLT2_9GLOM|nr:hypothetical protein Glove_16g154 [Diversispora epigaea]